MNTHKEKGEHISELKNFFETKLKKDKLDIAIKKGKRKKTPKNYSQLYLSTSENEFALVNKDDVVVTRVERIPKRNTEQTIETKQLKVNKNNSKLLTVKYNALFEYTDIEDYSQIFKTEIDPIERETAKIQNEIERLNKMKDKTRQMLEENVNTANMELQLVVEQLKEDKNGELRSSLMKQYIERRKDLFDINAKIRKRENTIHEHPV